MVSYSIAMYVARSSACNIEKLGTGLGMMLLSRVHTAIFTDSK